MARSIRTRCFTLLLPALIFPFFASAQTDLYFPPVDGSAWETTDPATLGWCPDRIDSLYAYLDAHHTKAFIVLKDGRIVLEHYFGTFMQDSLHYWASAGKTLTSTVVGIAQEQGFLSIEDPSGTYLGTGWTSETAAQEQQITVRNQLTMTSGLDDGLPDNHCTLDTCLQYLADAGTRWAYHNAPYTLLQAVVANATGQSFNPYFNAVLRDPIGMNGLWFPVDEDHVYFSNARSMARFGLLALNGMVWGTDTILHDTAYFHAATTPSQSLNPSYGYLWWLNGQPTYMLPQTQFMFPGPLMADAPAGMFNALGKNDQLLNVVPGQGLVLVRMGDAAEESLQVSTYFDNIIWQYMDELDCGSGIAEAGQQPTLSILPNPCKTLVRVTVPSGQSSETDILDALGRKVLEGRTGIDLDVSGLAPGIYTVRVAQGNAVRTARLVKQ